MMGKKSNESTEKNPHNEGQEAEDAIFAGCIATLEKLGLPSDLCDKIKNWYSSEEEKEEVKPDAYEDKGQGESMGW